MPLNGIIRKYNKSKAKTQRITSIKQKNLLNTQQNVTSAIKKGDLHRHPT